MAHQEGLSEQELAERSGTSPTVNIASRIADYARPTEVLVSEEVSSMEG